MKDALLVIGILTLIVSVLYNRHQNEKSLKALTDEEKGQLLNHFSSFRIYSFYALLSVIAVYGLFAYFQLFANMGLMYSLLLFVYLLVTQLITMKKLKEIDLPDAYLSAQKRIYTIRFIGLAVFVLTFVAYNQL